MNLESDKNNQQKIFYRKKFSLREFGGAFGDWGTLIPFIIGYVSIVGLSPAGIFLTLGITNIILGVRFNLPLPVQPQKTIGTVAISERWAPDMVISTGFGTGVIWFLLGLSKKLNKIVQKVPIISVRGIQLGLAFILGWAGIILFKESLILGFISILIILILIKNKPIPSAIILTLLGIFILLLSKTILLSDITFGLPSFSFKFPTWDNFVIGMIYAGIAQLFLTLTNVMIATVVLIKDLFPEREEVVDANSLALNMGIMNLISPFFVGMPTCHGSGGLMAQYAFGARTGGSMILEGIMEIFLGIFFSETLFLIFTEFPLAILGAMLMYTAFLLGRIAFKDSNMKRFPIILISGLCCFFLNITVGFFIGLGLFLIFKRKIEK
ncbi:MAG: putative sulfate/molybdate transporter [Candidatus Lokiarchaeota archaeon]|nr:putative sulfate/molybdate transporter [Candidatus Lokiarchaeota archaeon]